MLSGRRARLRVLIVKVGGTGNVNAIDSGFQQLGNAARGPAVESLRYLEIAGAVDVVYRRQFRIGPGLNAFRYRPAAGNSARADDTPTNASCHSVRTPRPRAGARMHRSPSAAPGLSDACAPPCRSDR